MATDSPEKVEFMAVAIPAASSSDFCAASMPGLPDRGKGHDKAVYGPQQAQKRRHITDHREIPRPLFEIGDYLQHGFIDRIAYAFGA